MNPVPASPRCQVLRRAVTIGALAVASLLCFTLPAESKSSILTTWKTLYPNSMSDDNAAASGSSCVLCHSSGSFNYNAYGWKINQFMNSGSSSSQAIQLAASFDSDADPTSSTNVAEITANSQPGWTPGPGNLIYSSNGSTTTTSPPAGILGTLDPQLCGAPASSSTYGVGKAGTNGVPTLVSNNPPALGGVTDLTIANGKPGALTLLFFGVSQASIPFDAGTLLVNPLGGPISLPLNGAGGISVPVPLPADPALCGFQAYFQAMFQDPGAVGALHTAQTAGLRWTLGS